MQLSKENSDAGGATGASARPPAAAHPPLCLGQRGPRRLQPSPPSEKKAQPRGDPSWRPALRSSAAESPPLGLAGARRPDGHRAVSASGAQSTRHHRARPGSAPPLPAPGPCPQGEEGVRSYLAQASVCHWGRRGRARHPPTPTRASRRLLNLQVTRRGERACALGLPGGGGARQAGGKGGGAPGGGPEGWGWSPRKEIERSPSCLCSPTATGSPRVAPRLPCHYLG